MWKYFFILVLTIGSLGLLSGCGISEAEQPKQVSSDMTINREDVSEEQFIEITLPDGEIIGQITELDAIISYMQTLDISQWKAIDGIPKQAEFLYTFTSYEKVTDEFWLEHGAPEITVTNYNLYQSGGDFYIEVNELSDSVSYTIPAAEGLYLTDLARITSEIKDKNDIFASWGVDDFDSNFWGTDLDDTEPETVKKDAENRRLYRAEDLVKVSKEQKMELSFSDQETRYTFSDLEIIADFYNHLEREHWTKLRELPNDKKEICTITTFQLERHTAEKKLIENEKLVLFEAEGEYYILDSIPAYSAESKAMELYYSISADIAHDISNFSV